MSEIDKKPVIRFKGFEDEWKQCKLLDLAAIVTKGTTPLDKSGNGDINFIKIENIDASFGKISITSKISEQEHNGYLKRSQLKNNDILFSIAGTLGRVAIVNSKVIPANTNQAIAIIRLKSENINYIATYLKGRTISEYIRKNPTIGAQPNLSLEQVGNFEISLPIKQEQLQIETFFRKLDNIIELYQKKYNQLINLKETMLEKMFPNNGEKIPEIRFKEFVQDWKKSKLGDIMDVTSVKRIHQSDWTTSGVRFLRARDIVADFKGENPDDFLYISKKIYDEYSKISGKTNINDLLVTGVGTIGIPYLIKNSEPIYFKDGNIIWFKNNNSIDGKFFYYSFIGKNIQQFINESAGIGTVGTYTIESGKNTPILLPQKEEEEKVGQFFKELDNLISLYRNKLEKLKNIKDACLTKMFI